METHGEDPVRPCPRVPGVVKQSALEDTRSSGMVSSKFPCCKRQGIGSYKGSANISKSV